MARKLTISITDEVHDGLHAKVNLRKIDKYRAALDPSVGGKGRNTWPAIVLTRDAVENADRHFPGL